MPKDLKSGGVKSPVESGMYGIPPGMPGKPSAKKSDKEASPVASSLRAIKGAKGPGGKLPPYANE
jgi:hypothetical protein